MAMPCSPGDALYVPRTRPMTRHLDPFAKIRTSYTLRYESGMIETNVNPMNMQRFSKQQLAAMQVGEQLALTTRLPCLTLLQDRVGARTGIRFGVRAPLLIVSIIFFADKPCVFVFTGRCRQGKEEERHVLTGVHGDSSCVRCVVFQHGGVRGRAGAGHGEQHYRAGRVGNTQNCAHAWGGE